MIIQLKGADASAENLGKVNIPEHFDEDAMILLSNMTKYSLYSKEALCVNQVIADLKENSLWDKVQLFYTPWMAATVDELEYNLQGVALSVNKDNLYFQDGALYAHTVSYDMRNVLCTMPLINVKNNFIVISLPYSTVDSSKRKTMGFIRNSNNELCAMANTIADSQVCGLGTAFNYNNILSPNNMSMGGVINISNNFTGVNPSDLTTFTVNGQTPSVKGSLTAKTEKEVNRIGICRHFGETSQPTKLWIDSECFKPIYIIGNTVLTSAEVTTMVSIITKYSNNI